MTSNRRILAISMLSVIIAQGAHVTLGHQSQAAAVVNQGMMEHYKGLRMGRKFSGAARAKRISRKHKNIRARSVK